jgi:O-antigen/teichoic acid export membrane protein
VTSFRRVLTNAGWNLLGNFLPLVAAAALMPIIIRNLGLDRFGLLSLAWVLIGYFSLFDFGLGRAITKMVAERSAEDDRADIASITSTGMAVLVALGVVGALCVVSISPVAGFWLARLPAPMAAEARSSIYLIAICIPIVVATSGLRGVLEGFQEFRLLNAIRIPAGILLFAAPAITSAWSARLDATILGLVITRAAILLAHVPPSLTRVAINTASVRTLWVRPLIQFGGWLTVSSVIGPIIVYLDRFVLGSLQTPEALAFYAAPFEVVSRMLVLPLSLTVALFPVLADLNRNVQAQAQRLRISATALITWIIVPLCAIGAAMAKPILNVWLGPEFAANSTLALQILLPGFALNSLAQIPVVVLQSSGRAKFVGMLHLCQLPIYACLLYMLTKRYGIPGAATAWSVRAAFDCVALFIIQRIVDARKFRSVDAALT